MCSMLQEVVPRGAGHSPYRDGPFAVHVSGGDGQGLKAWAKTMIDSQLVPGAQQTPPVSVGSSDPMHRPHAPRPAPAPRLFYG